MLTTGTPLLWLSLAVVALVAVGLTGLRRRDISP
jgi:putative exporter of polyketide antibiotics